MTDADYELLLQRAPAIVRSPRDAWLDERRKGVGASEVAAILGVDPRRGPLAVYADKVAGKLGEPEEAWLAFGREVEGAIARGYARKTGRPLHVLDPYAIVRHPRLPVLGATLDAETEGSEQCPAPGQGRGVLEAKAVGFHKRDEWGLATAPLPFVVQVQAQMACRGVTWGTLAALMGGIAIADPVDMVPSADFVEVMLLKVERFWWHVTNQVPPAPDPTPGTQAAYRALYPADKGTTIALPPELFKAAQRLDDLADEVQALKDEEAILKGQFKLALGSNTWGVLVDGSRMQWRLEHKDEYTVPPSDTRVLRRVSRPKRRI
jgi:putative phage-type endonuclease